MPGMTPEHMNTYGRMAASIKERFGDNWQIVYDPERDDEASVRTEDSTATNYTELFNTHQTGSDDPLEVAGFLAAAIDYVPALITRVERLKARVAELQPFELGIKSLTTSDGSIDMDLHMAHEMMRIYVAAFVEILDKEGGPNYVEMVWRLAGSLDRYTVTIRRPDGKSPAEVIRELRRCAEQTTDQAARMAEENARLVARVAELETDQDERTNDVAQLAAERDEARAERDTAQAEVERLTAQRDALLRRCDRHEASGVHVISILMIRDYLKVTGGGETPC